MSLIAAMLVSGINDLSVFHVIINPELARALFSSLNNGHLVAGVVRGPFTAATAVEATPYGR